MRFFETPVVPGAVVAPIAVREAPHTTVTTARVGQGGLETIPVILREDLD